MPEDDEDALMAELAALEGVRPNKSEFFSEREPLFVREGTSICKGGNL